MTWDEVYERRLVIAEGVGDRLGLSFPLGVKEPFGSLDLTAQNLASVPMWRVPFYTIAKRMTVESCRVIDHAWWLIADDRSGEPWGFVTEPYMDPGEAREIADFISRKHVHWGVEAYVLERAESAWYPGETVPIICIVHPGCLNDFLKLGVRSALACMP